LYEVLKDLGTLSNSELHFHYHIDYMIHRCLKMFGLIRYITSSFSTTDKDKGIPVLFN